MVATGTADAVDRETAWLTTVGDGLPALLAAAGGRWDSVQAYMTRVPALEQRTIYVMRARIRQERWGGQRVSHRYPFRLLCIWPILDGDGAAEADQREFDLALDDVLQRLLGPLGNKTHGGRFLSVGENPSTVEVEFEPPEHTIPAMGALQAQITYTADDNEINA